MGRAAVIHFSLVRRRKPELSLMKIASQREAPSHYERETIPYHSSRCVALITTLLWLTSAPAPTTFDLGCAKAPRLAAVVVTAPPRLRQDASFLHLTAEP